MGKGLGRKPEARVPAGWMGWEVDFFCIFAGYLFFYYGGFIGKVATRAQGVRVGG